MRLSLTVVAVLWALSLSLNPVSALTVVVETWLHLPHSYAVVGQFLLVQLMGLAVNSSVSASPNTPTVSPSGVGFNPSHWAHPLTVGVHQPPLFRRGWRRHAGLFPPNVEAVLDSVPDASAPTFPCADVVLRTGFPLDLSHSTPQPHCPPPAHVYVFGTTEYGTCVDAMLTSPRLQSWPHVPDRVVVMPPSDWARLGFIKSGVPVTKLWTLPHGVDTSIFHPLPAVSTARSDLRSSFGWSPDTTVLLHIGSMTRNKGLHLMGQAVLDVARSLPPSRLPLLLFLKGNDGLYSSSDFVRRFLPASVLQHPHLVRVEYSGATLSFSEVASLMQAADVYLSPYSAEGFNLPVLEAVACGLPVICTSGGPTDAFTRHPDFALHVNSTTQPVVFMNESGTGLVPDARHFTALVHAAVTDAAWRDAARLAGPTFVRRRFGWDRVVRSWLARVQRDLSSFGGHTAPLAATLRSVALSTVPNVFPHMTFPHPTVVFPPADRPFDVRLSVSGATPTSVPLCVVLAPAWPQPSAVSLTSCTASALPLPGVIHASIVGIPSGCYFVSVTSRTADTDTLTLVPLPSHLNYHVQYVDDQGRVLPASSQSVLSVAVLVPYPPSVPPSVASLTSAVSPPVTTSPLPSSTSLPALAALFQNVGLVDVSRVLHSLVAADPHQFGIEASVGHALASIGCVSPVQSSPVNTSSVLATIRVLHAVAPAVPPSFDVLSHIPTLTDRYLAFPSALWSYSTPDVSAVMAASARLLATVSPSLLYVAPRLQQRAPPPPPPTDSPAPAIRVGFVSCGLFNHSVGRVLAGVILWLASLTDTFHVTAVRCRRPDSDPTDPIVAALHDSAPLTVISLPPAQSVSLSTARDAVEAAELDVIVYGDVGVEPLSYFLSFSRLAAVQCAMWGSPVSSGSPGIDYFIAGDAFFVPSEPFSEQVVWLPRLAVFLYPPSTSHTRQTTNSTTSLRRRWGLPTSPDTHILFCPQSLVKVHPSFLSAVGRVLSAAPDAHVVLLEGRGEAWRGQVVRMLDDTVPSDVLHRVHILPRLPTDDYAAMAAAATVVLDTFPYSGFTTSIDALTVGTPVVTLKGDTVRGSQTAALYNVMGGMDACVATTVDEYVETVVSLVTGDGQMVRQLATVVASNTPRLFRDTDVIQAWVDLLTSVVKT